MQAGYSATPLIRKLGIKPGMKIVLLHPPNEYASWLGQDIAPLRCKKNETPDLVHLFVKNFAAFDTAMKKLEEVYKKNRALVIWVSWYKKSSKIPTNMTEDLIRQYALQHGLVDVKVCAVSENWSALKLVVPLKKR